MVLCRQVWGVVIILSMAFVLACGSAVEVSDTSQLANFSLTQDKTLPLVLGEYDARIDPNAGTFTLEPTNTLGNQLANVLVPSHNDNLGFLAATYNVTHDSTWSGRIFDESNNSIPVHGDMGACLTNNESQSVVGVKANFTEFSDSNVTMGEGATSISGGYEVDYGDIPSHSDKNWFNYACRRFTFTNTAATAYTFRVAFEGDSLTGMVNSFVNGIKESQYSQPGTYFMKETGPGLDASINFDIHGRNFGSSPEVYVGATQFTNMGSTTNELISDIVPAAGVTTTGQVRIRNTDTAQDVYGPYVAVQTQVHLALVLPGGNPDTTSTLYYSVCASPPGCTVDANGCVTNAVDSEILHETTITTNAATAAPHMNNINSAGTYEMYALFDLDRSGTKNSGDLYHITSAFTVSLGESYHFAGNPAFANTLSGNCP